MERKFESIITLAQISDGAPGESGASKYELVGNAQKVIFYYAEKKDNKPEELIISPSILSFGIKIKENEDFVNLNEGTVTLILSTLDGAQLEPNLSYKIDKIVDTENNDKESYYVRFNIQEFFSSYIKDHSLDQYVINFSYSKNGERLASTNVLVENSFPSDLFKLTQHLYGFNAIMKNTKLQFNENGMSLTNGNFYIKNDDRDLLISENGNLKIVGQIHAQAGGTIGGFDIQENKLVSKKTYNDKPAIVIDAGDTGRIEVNEIILGKGATLESFMKLGDNAAILNPTQNNHKFITARNFVLTDEGRISLGNIEKETGIEIFGGDDTASSSYIKALNNKWSILGSGRARFDEIEANNLTLHNAIMTAGSTQAVGSSMVYRPSYAVVSWNSNEQQITIDSGDALEVGTWVYVNKTYLKVVSSQEGSFKYKGTVTGITKDSIVINLGKAGEDCVPSLYGGKSKIGAPSFSEPNSLVFAEITENTVGQIGFHKKIILGDLGTTRGFGLYGENVFLKGSLVTETNTGGPYAGINTMYGTDFEKQGKIVFWAGATSESDVITSPFFVTDKGFLRAKNANIIGSTFSGTVIASEIKAATIRGSSVDIEDMTTKEGTLTILDAGVGEGIIFAKTEKKEDDNGEEIETRKQIFSIGPDGMKTGSLENAQYFIKIEGEKASFVATKGDKKVVLDGAEAALNLVHKGNKQLSIGLNKNNEGAIFINEVDLVSFEGGKTKIKSTLSAYGEVDFGEGKMTYKKVAEGYNLYIS